MIRLFIFVCLFCVYVLQSKPSERPLFFKKETPWNQHLLFVFTTKLSKTALIKKQLYCFKPCRVYFAVPINTADYSSSVVDFCSRSPLRFFTFLLANFTFSCCSSRGSETPAEISESLSATSFSSK